MSRSWLGESHPSFGINANFHADSGEVLQVWHCFSCGSSGTIPTLLMKAMPERFKSFGFAMNFLKNRYGLEFHTFKKKANLRHIKRYGETKAAKESGKSKAKV